LNDKNEVVEVIATGTPNFTRAKDIIGYRYYISKETYYYS
jgi:hypothetical protein